MARILHNCIQLYTHTALCRVRHGPRAPHGPLRSRTAHRSCEHVRALKHALTLSVTSARSTMHERTPLPACLSPHASYSILSHLSRISTTPIDSLLAPLSLPAPLSNACSGIRTPPSPDTLLSLHLPTRPATAAAITTTAAPSCSGLVLSVLVCSPGRSSAAPRGSRLSDAATPARPPFGESV